MLIALDTGFNSTANRRALQGGGAHYIKGGRHCRRQFVWSSTRVEPRALACYQRKRQQGKSPSVAVGTLSNVWVRIIFAIWWSRQPYEVQRFLAAQAAHASKVA